ncbi:hypothetical protein CspHIS471_0608430 [Cutaneotrichosporon sp. HIS471]|nr:hypothetical protein CspHIS471_0608430 [Cutaneotrichosporon sp. HIS471]
MASSSTDKGKSVEYEPVHEAHHSLEETSIAWPVVRSEEIDDAMEHRVHFLDENKGRTQACLSEMAGIESMGIHKVTLSPHTESTVLHSHLSESPDNGVEVQETLLHAGDFAGFPAGNPKERWAHSLRAGDEAVTYILGGERKSVDVITYPTLGRTLVSHEESGAEAMFTGRSD